MVGRDEKGRFRRLAISLALLAILEAGKAAAAPDSSRLRIADTGKHSAVEEAVSGAVRDATAKLSDAACRQVFSDFLDASGRTIEENLGVLGQTAQSYLAQMLFYDGSGKPVCDNRAILAATAPGSKVVYICRLPFWTVQNSQPGLAAVLIIHEELHSLGLPENPPASRQITQQVITRCGR